MVQDGLAELHPLLSVVQGVLVGGPRQADGAGGEWVRVRSKVRMAILKPSPSSPSRFSAGTSTSSSARLAVTEARMPSLRSGGPGTTPGRSASTMKAVIPRSPRETSTVAKTTYRSAMPALVMKCL